MSRRRFAQHTAPRSRPCVHRRGVVEKRFTRRKAARPLNARSTRYSRFVVFFHTVALTRAACRATRQWWSILLCGTLLEACLALGPQIRRAAKLGNPFSTYKKTRQRPSCRRIQRSLYVARGSRSFGTTTSISSGVHCGRGRSQNNTYLDWCELRSPATIEVPVRRCQIVTGCFARLGTMGGSSAAN